jgi:hypothetical protein
MLPLTSLLAADPALVLLSLSSVSDSTPVYCAAQSALHVSVAQSAQCMMKFGMTTDALKPAPALSADAEVSPTSVFDFARQQSLGHRHDFGACMATPPDFESKEARTTVRTGSSAVASALASSSSSQSAALRWGDCWFWASACLTACFVSISASSKHNHAGACCVAVARIITSTLLCTALHAGHKQLPRSPTAMRA